jgi:hypothetical protein
MSPFDSKYILRISKIRSGGSYNSSPNTYHNFSLFMESYARRRSIKAIPNCLLAFILCYITVYRINACSMVEWCARNPACVGACRLSCVAVVVSRLLIVAMKTFAKGGGMAMLR